uniref:Uncharacterized protein n=1 Tax=Rhizophora mucronata TaxID=61149 RepID=A0A2P2QIQ7_RHIMU
MSPFFFFFLFLGNYPLVTLLLSLYFTLDLCCCLLPEPICDFLSFT